MAIWTLARKEIRLLLRDRVAALILIGMPVLFMYILGSLVDDGYGQKERLRISVVNLDQGPCSVKGYDNWAAYAQKDLQDTGGVVVERIESMEEANRLIREHRRAAVLVFGPNFSSQVEQCSFLIGGVNPFHHDGVYLDRLGVELVRDPQQIANAAVIDQVAQVSLLRVLLPLMIGRAFGKLSDEKFIKILGEEVNLPLPASARPFFGFKDKVKLGAMLDLAAGNNEKSAAEYRQKVGEGVQGALTRQFKNYNLEALTWEELVRDPDQLYKPQDRGTNGARYQIIVPAFTVMFAFFLVLNVGWVLVSERQQGTLNRLRMAPILPRDILLGKFFPYLLLSLIQGIFLLVAGKAFFGMRWGPDDWSLGYQILWILPVVAATSMAAMGLAMLVASLARTEAQVALYGGVPVLVMALIGGCVLPRDLMPEQTQWVTFLTPHGWALSAYRELLPADGTYQPNLEIVTRACLVLVGFGTAFLAAAWASLRLD